MNSKDDDTDHPEALAILETLAGRFNELQDDLKAGEQITIKVSGVAIEQLAVRGSMLWLYGRDRGPVRSGFVVDLARADRGRDHPAPDDYRKGRHSKAIANRDRQVPGD